MEPVAKKLSELVKLVQIKYKLTVSSLDSKSHHKWMFWNKRNPLTTFTFDERDLDEILMFFVLCQLFFGFEATKKIALQLMCVHHSPPKNYISISKDELWTSTHLKGLLSFITSLSPTEAPFLLTPSQNPELSESPLEMSLAVPMVLFHQYEAPKPVETGSGMNYYRLDQFRFNVILSMMAHQLSVVSSLIYNIMMPRLPGSLVARGVSGVSKSLSTPIETEVVKLETFPSFRLFKILKSKDVSTPATTSNLDHTEEEDLQITISRKLYGLINNLVLEIDLNSPVEITPKRITLMKPYEFMKRADENRSRWEGFKMVAEGDGDSQSQSTPFLSDESQEPAMKAHKGDYFSSIFGDFCDEEQDGTEHHLKRSFSSSSSSSSSLNRDDSQSSKKNKFKSLNPKLKFEEAFKGKEGPSYKNRHTSINQKDVSVEDNTRNHASKSNSPSEMQAEMEGNYGIKVGRISEKVKKTLSLKNPLNTEQLHDLELLPPCLEREYVKGTLKNPEIQLVFSTLSHFAVSDVHLRAMATPFASNVDDMKGLFAQHLSSFAKKKYLYTCASIKKNNLCPVKDDYNELKRKCGRSCAPAMVLTRKINGDV